MVSFVDITVRSLLQGSVSSTVLMYLSFTWLILMYATSYFFLWRHFAKRKDLEHLKLLEYGTLSIIMSDMLIYASLFQVGNNHSNFTWLAFYLVLIALFYLLGKRSIKQVAI